jgi:N-acetylglucosaminyldiphosphoundecaprenol N-acetyl-beta-D-mannosaminyltransferase
MTARGPDIEFLGMGFDSSGYQAVLVELIARPAEAPFAYLVTPNVDHIVRLHDNALAEGRSLWDAYKGATWRTCDSRSPNGAGCPCP